MGRLTQRPQDSVVIDGATYPVETDFRVCLDTFIALSDKTLTPIEKIDVLIYNMFDDVPDNLQGAVEAALSFLSGGASDEQKKKPKLCDFEQDGEYIYAALLKKGIDIYQVERMHWHTFMAHVSEIPESTFSRIVYLRTQKNRGKLTREERQEIERLGWNVINLYDAQEEQERTEFEKILAGE